VYLLYILPLLSSTHLWLRCSNFFYPSKKNYLACAVNRKSRRLISTPTYHGTWAHLNGVLNKSLPSIWVSVCVSCTVARQRLGKNVTVATNTHATIELLDASFSVRSVSYQRKVGG
jgi:hypothetical protein